MSWDFFQKPKMQNEVPGKSKALIWTVDEVAYGVNGHQLQRLDQ